MNTFFFNSSYYIPSSHEINLLQISNDIFNQFWGKNYLFLILSMLFVFWHTKGNIEWKLYNFIDGLFIGSILSWGTLMLFNKFFT